jgi:hypothetical protein
MQLIIMKLNEIIFTTFGNVLQCTLLLQVDLSNKQLADVFVLPKQQNIIDNLHKMRINTYL